MNNNDQNNKREICRYLNNLKVVVLGVKSQAFKCFGLNYFNLLTLTQFYTVKVGHFSA